MSNAEDSVAILWSDSGKPKPYFEFSNLKSYDMALIEAKKIIQLHL